jgi:hypothetical protein
MGPALCRPSTGRCDVKSDVFEQVEAALLDSQGDPKREVDNALGAVAKFAVIECEISLTDFLKRAEAAYREALKVP